MEVIVIEIRKLTFMDEWVVEWMDVKVILRIAHSKGKPLLTKIVKVVGLNNKHVYF
jgi:hypothetical protein